MQVVQILEDQAPLQQQISGFLYATLEPEDIDYYGYFNLSSSKHCPDLVDFLVNSGFDFCSVDITQDRVKLMRIGIMIPEDHYVDLQNLIQLTGPKTGMAVMASTFIHQGYERMKTDFRRENHFYWEETPLRMTNLKYAAIDAYVAYELFRIYSAGP